MCVIHVEKAKSLICYFRISKNFIKVIYYKRVVRKNHLRRNSRNDLEENFFSILYSKKLPPEIFYKKGVLKNSREKNCARFSF